MTPDMVSFGVRQNLNDWLRVMGTVEWTNWSRLGIVPIYLGNSANVLTTLPLRYRDGWLVSLGFEYDYSERLTLRSGVGYEIAPVDNVSRDVRMPETNQLITSAGVSYRYSSSLSFDLSYTHAFGLGDGRVSIGGTDPRFLGLPFEASSTLSIGIVSASASYTF